jgi:hypothetical protein
VNRWGDYSMMAVDPSDDCTFWYVNEYLRSSVGTFNWSTRIGSFKFPACGMLQPPKPVPDGRYVAGALMRASRNGNGVDLTWDTSTCSSPAYNLYYGAIGSFAAIAGAICGLPPGGSAANLAIPDDSFWVVAGANASEVSSFGRDGAGAEEDFTGWPGRCAQATQVTSATCP